MKKTFLLLLFAVTFSAVAQVTLPQEYTIHKPLKLDTVLPSESLSDSVLVRGVDNIVKQVPRSAFGGGGGSQDLTSVLTNGYSVNNLPIFINRTDGAFQSGFRLINPVQYTELGDGSVRIVKNDLSQDTNYGNGYINYAFNADGSFINLQIPAVNIGTKYLPVSVNSKYADATGNVVNTLDDNMVYGENLVTGSPDFGNKGIKFQSFSSPSDYTEIYPSGISFSGASSIFNIAYTGYSLGNGFNTLSGDSNGFSYSYDGSFSRRYNFPIPTNNLAKTFAISVDGNFADANGNVVITPTYTVSTLPTPTGRAFAIVTDATAPTYLGTLTGGGSVVCPVFYNGTAWIAY